jgi:CheY-like chemotaxis protein
MLPMSGLDVLRELKQDAATRTIPVLLHSVSDEPEQLLALGAADFLPKPVSGAQLRETVRRALDRTPVPLYLLDGDDARRERVRRALEETGLDVNPARTRAEAIAIPAIPAPVVVLGPSLPDGPAAPLLAHWCGDPAFRDATVVLIGAWPEDSLEAGAGCRVEALHGQRAADAVGRVRAVLAGRRHATDEGADG